MKLLDKSENECKILLSKEEVSIVTSALSEIPNILDAHDCETRTGFLMEDFNKMFVFFSMIDDR